MTGKPTLLGIGFDSCSSYLRGAGAALPMIREALGCSASNDWTETGVDLGGDGAYEDAGDLALDDQDALSGIEAGVAKILEQGARPVSLGGDHSITYPLVKAFARKCGELTIVHFDAHPDLYDEFEGNRLSHACPFARIIGGAGKATGAGWDSDDEPASAGAGASIRRRCGGDAGFAGV